MAYVDGFVLALPKRKVKAYVQIARKAGKVFKDEELKKTRMPTK